MKERQTIEQVREMRYTAPTSGNWGDYIFKLEKSYTWDEILSLGDYLVQEDLEHLRFIGILPVLWAKVIELTIFYDPEEDKSIKSIKRLKSEASAIKFTGVSKRLDTPLEVEFVTNKNILNISTPSKEKDRLWQYTNELLSKKFT